MDPFVRVMLWGALMVLCAVSAMLIEVWMGKRRR